MYAPDGLWELIRRFTGFFNIPIIAVVLVGIFARKVPAVAAKVVIIFHVVTYYMLIWGMNQLFGIPININYIHVYGILFFTEIVIMLAISRISPRKEAWKFTPKPKVDMKPWKYSLFTSVVLIGFVFAFYLVFSPIGLAYKQGYVSPYFWPSLGLLSIVTISIAILSVKKWNKKYGSYIEKTTSSTKTISS
jgi:SSS family solute:Na+ symporter